MHSAQPPTPGMIRADLEYRLHRIRRELSYETDDERRGRLLIREAEIEGALRRAASESRR